MSSIAHVTPPSTAYWAFKLNQKLASSGLGSTRVTRDSHVLVYYTTFDPETGATQPTLGITASTKRSRRRTAGSPSGSAPTTMRGRPRPPPAPSCGSTAFPTHVNANGAVTLRFARGTSSVRAVEPGAIRSQKLWVHAS